MDFQGNDPVDKVLEVSADQEQDPGAFGKNQFLTKPADQ